MISIVTRASGCTQDSAKAIARELIGLGVMGIVGGYCSDDSIGLLQVTQAMSDPVPAISYSYFTFQDKICSDAIYVKVDFGLMIDIDELINAVDTDGSGEIEYDEFKVRRALAQMVLLRSRAVHAPRWQRSGGYFR